MIAVVDYGMGNLRSMAKALEYVGGEVVVTADTDVIREAERIVLPGVGAFGQCAENLRATGLVDTLRDEVLGRGKPFFGVCVGMQLLAEEGHEHGDNAGLGWLAGSVLPVRHTGPGVRIPHTGWNTVNVLGAAAGTPLEGIRSGEAFYFNHSFHLVPDDRSTVALVAGYGQTIVAAIAFDNVIATQFHPEKSQHAGLELLADFVDWQPAARPDQAIRTSTP